MIVGDTPTFGHTVTKILKMESRDAWDIRHTTYPSLRGILTPRFLREIDCFVLELFRTYPTGIRAEAIPVAEELGRLQVRTMIVSPLALGEIAAADGYWDTGTHGRISDRIERLLGDRVRANLDGLKACMASFLARQEGHEDTIFAIPER